MISPTHLVTAGAALATMLTAQAQTVTDISSVTDQWTNSSSGAGVASIASSYAFAEQIPALDQVTLEEVLTTSTLSASVVVTVRNPTSNTINGSLRLMNSYAVDATLGAWGPGVDDSTVIIVPVGALQPGETRDVTWTFGETFHSAHSPTTNVGGLWADVLDTCVGPGNIEFGSFIVTEYRRALPDAIEVVNVEVSAGVEMELELTTGLASSPDAAPFCPNPVFGGSTPAVMEAFGTLNAADLDYCLLQTSFVPDGFPAIVYVTTDAANLPTAAGNVCLGGERLFRAQPQLGNSSAPIEFRLEPVMGAAGMSVYAQTFYRTLQQGVRVTGAIELPLQ